MRAYHALLPQSRPADVGLSPVLISERNSIGAVVYSGRRVVFTNPREMMAKRSLLSVLFLIGASTMIDSTAIGQTEVRPLAALENLSEVPVTAALSTATRIGGLSGELRIAMLSAPDRVDMHVLQAAQESGGARFRWIPLMGTRSLPIGSPAFSSELAPPETTGIWGLESEAAPGSPLLSVVSPVPFAAKSGGMLNGYHIGTYPTEGSDRADQYAPPSAFIEITPENQDLQISSHFRFRQFLTKDQASVWPKYLVIRLELIDKLELVMQELNRMGVRAERMYVMSGFRTPQYNGPGGDGRAALSRHMYGDAADVWIDNDGDGYIDDLNGDGLSDPRDLYVMLRAVERVEAKYPMLVGGAGLYAANEAHGPFIHIDVRGTLSRW